MTEDKEQLCHAGKAFQDASIKIQLKGQVWCCDYNNLRECPSVQRSEIEAKGIPEAKLLFMVLFFKSKPELVWLIQHHFQQLLPHLDRYLWFWNLLVIWASQTLCIYYALSHLIVSNTLTVVLKLLKCKLFFFFFAKQNNERMETEAWLHIVTLGNMEGLLLGSRNWRMFAVSPNELQWHLSDSPVPVPYINWFPSFYKKKIEDSRIKGLSLIPFGFKVLMVWWEDQNLPKFLVWLCSNYSLTGHNITFELYVLCKFGGVGWLVGVH